MKKHLFYTFLFLFIATAIITLGGITKLIQIDEFYLKGLFASLILELCGAVILMYRKVDFFDADTPEERIPKPALKHNTKNENAFSKSDLPKKPLNIKGLKPTTITVKEVIDSINSAPPFQKDEISEKYIGLLFEQVGYLGKIEQNWDDKSKVRVNILLNKEDIIGNSIWFSTSLKETPEIKVLQKGGAIKVKGVLISASGAGLSITLQPTDIEVLGTRIVA